jgi:hypothetical protein
MTDSQSRIGSTKWAKKQLPKFIRLHCPTDNHNRNFRFRRPLISLEIEAFQPLTGKIAVVPESSDVKVLRTVQSRKLILS